MYTLAHTRTEEQEHNTHMHNTHRRTHHKHAYMYTQTYTVAHAYHMYPPHAHTHIIYIQQTQEREKERPSMWPQQQSEDFRKICHKDQTWQSQATTHPKPHGLQQRVPDHPYNLFPEWRQMQDRAAFLHCRQSGRGQGQAGEVIILHQQ